MRNLFSVASEKRKFIYEVQPWMFGNSFTPNEFEYWLAFFALQQAEIHNIDESIYDIEEVNEIIRSKRTKQEQELEKMSKKNMSGFKRRVTYGN